MTEKGSPRAPLPKEGLCLAPVDLIDANTWNPNEMEKEVAENMSDYIQERGIHGTLLLRWKDGGRLEVIDGEHRLAEAKKQKIKEVPAFIIDVDEDTAMMDTVRMNHLKGETNPVKLAAIISKLSQKYDKEALRKGLGIKKSDFGSAYQEHVKKLLPREIRQIIGENVKSFKDIEATVRKETMQKIMKQQEDDGIQKNREYFLGFYFSYGDYQKVREALKLAEQLGAADLNHALLMLAENMTLSKTSDDSDIKKTEKKEATG